MTKFANGVSRIEIRFVWPVISITDRLIWDSDAFSTISEHEKAMHEVSSVV